MKIFIITAFVLISFAQPLLAGEVSDRVGLGLIVGTEATDGFQSLGLSLQYDINVTEKFQIALEGSRRFSPDDSIIKFLSFGLLQGKKTILSQNMATASLRFKPSGKGFFVGGGAGAFHGNLYYKPSNYHAFRDGTFLFGEVGFQGSVLGEGSYYTFAFRFAKPTTDTGTFDPLLVPLAGRPEAIAEWGKLVKNSVVTLTLSNSF